MTGELKLYTSSTGILNSTRLCILVSHKQYNYHHHHCFSLLAHAVLTLASDILVSEDVRRLSLALMSSCALKGVSQI